MAGLARCFLMGVLAAFTAFLSVLAVCGPIAILAIIIGLFIKLVCWVVAF